MLFIFWHFIFIYLFLFFEIQIERNQKCVFAYITIYSSTLLRFISYCPVTFCTFILINFFQILLVCDIMLQICFDNFFLRCPKFKINAMLRHSMYWYYMILSLKNTKSVFKATFQSYFSVLNTFIVL